MLFSQSLLLDLVSLTVVFQTKGKSGKQARGGKKKKTTLKFTVDCTHPVEDGILDPSSFVS